MPTMTDLSADHPVSRAIAQSEFAIDRAPVPLVSTTYDIKISGGLADVIATRTFRNDEPQSIEALLTFPLPVHAVLHGLEARIDGRVVVAEACAKSEARGAYEAAIDQGKTTVLHEVLMPGIHMMSVGHIAPGAEIGVTARFALSLSIVGSRVFLRIPTTVGDVYGSSGLSDSDELRYGSETAMADVTISCDCGDACLSRSSLVEGKARVALDAPIVLDIKGWKPRPLAGRAADRRGVELQIAPAPIGSGAIDAAIVVDRSGSMSELCEGAAGLSKHAAVLLGLSEAAENFGAADRIELWEFSDDVRRIGRSDAANWRSMIRQLGGPGGGTRIGRALEAVAEHSSARDLLLLTDGKSFDVDVHRLAGMGRRITVVLIGEDSLEAGVGHLAALTHGDILVPDSPHVATAVSNALSAIRRSSDLAGNLLRRGGMALETHWNAADEQSGASSSDPRLSRAVAAFAASLLLPSLSASEATALAVAEGLVTHLTSLVLVDEHGGAQVGLPTTRKVALSPPRTLSTNSSVMLAAVAFAPSPASRSRQVAAVHKRREQPSTARTPRDESAERSTDRGSEPRRRRGAVPDRASCDLIWVCDRIDWVTLGPSLAGGDLTCLEKSLADEICVACELEPVRKVAVEVGLSPLMLVVGLLARSMAGRDRHADRVSRAVLATIDPRQLTRASHCLGL